MNSGDIVVHSKLQSITSWLPECEECFVEYCLFHITLLWVWRMLWFVWNYMLQRLSNTMQLTAKLGDNHWSDEMTSSSKCIHIHPQIDNFIQFCISWGYYLHFHLWGGKKNGKLSFNFKNLKLVLFCHRINIDVIARRVHASGSRDMLCTYSKTCLHESD